LKRYKVLCPLVNFQIQNVFYGPTQLSDDEVTKLLLKRGAELREGIELFEGMKIRPVSKEDSEDFKASPLILYPHKSVTSATFVLEKYINSEDENFSDIHHIMLNGVLALRLLKKGNIFGNAVFYILLSEKRELNESSWEEEPIPEFPGHRYALNFDEIPALKQILEKGSKDRFP